MAVGHSFGGATCLTACNSDLRFKACAVFDVWLFPLSLAMAHATLRIPTLFLVAETFDNLWPKEGRKTFDNLWPKEGRKVLDGFLRRARASGVPIEAFKVIGSRHQNFSDFPVLAPGFTQALGMAGPTKPSVVIEVANKCAISFLLHNHESTEAVTWV
ncbi:platelet-activating factor acetylhydrolase [Baffinella frigidus]|nr:platelet-activating factor acetylhydrolase [Cryptophyta sp. CCMP2293]